MRPWMKEFGLEYAVPEIIDAMADALVVKDTSWHNDESPSFGIEMSEGEYLSLWVGHPIAARRPFPLEKTPRYMVTVGDDKTLMETDDLFAALSEFFRYQSAHPRPNAGEVLESVEKELSAGFSTGQKNHFVCALDMARVGLGKKSLVKQCAAVCEREGEPTTERDGWLYHPECLSELDKEVARG